MLGYFKYIRHITYAREVNQRQRQPHVHTPHSIWDDSNTWTGYSTWVSRTCLSVIKTVGL